MSTDVLSGYRTAAGITITLPEVTIWGVKLRISIKVTIAAVLAANDAVLITMFTDGQSQTILNQSSNPLDQEDMLFSALYLTKSVMYGSSTTGAGTFVLYEEYDIKAHRRLKQAQDTLFLQFATTGQPQITEASVAQSILLKTN